MSTIKKPSRDTTGQILELLKNEPGITRHRITEALGITDSQKKANLGPILSGMKALGYITSEKIAAGPAHAYFIAAGADDQPTPEPARCRATDTQPQNFAELTDVSSAIADMVAKAIAGPVRARVEQTVQDIIRQATANFQERVMAAIGQIPAINIPINVPMNIRPAAPEQRKPDPVRPPAPVALAPTVELPRPSVKPKITVDLEPPPVEQPHEKWTPYIAPTAQPVTEPEPSKERIRATVVGLKPGQAHMIRNEFGRQMKLTFIESDGGHGQQLGALSRTSDYVILMTKFVNHATSEHIKKNGGTPVECNGGMTTLRDLLTQLYVEHDDKQKATEAIAA